MNNKNETVLRKAAEAIKARGHDGDARLSDSVLGVIASLKSAERATPAAASAGAAGTITVTLPVDTMWAIYGGLKDVPGRTALAHKVADAIRQAQATEGSTPACRNQGGICACRSGGSYGGCAIERAATAPVSAAPTQQGATVYPPDGTTSPFTVINLGAGKVKIGDSLHDARLPALWFGKNGTGMGDEEIMNRAAADGETLAVVTFANVEGLDVLQEVVARIRASSFPDAPQSAGAPVRAVTVDCPVCHGLAIHTHCIRCNGSGVVAPLPVRAADQAEINAALDRADAEDAARFPGGQKLTTMECPECGTDRLKEPCPRMADECAMRADAHLLAKAAAQADANSPQTRMDAQSKPLLWLSSQQVYGLKAITGVYLPFQREPGGNFDFPVYAPDPAGEWVKRADLAMGQQGKFKRGDDVRKTRGSQWSGKVVGHYSTELTPEGYAVESSTERGSVQIYPVGALEFVAAKQAGKE